MKFRRSIFLTTTRMTQYINHWDVMALLLVIGILMAVGHGIAGIGGKYEPGQSVPISLAASALPGYAMRTVMRMFIAMILSLLFTFIFGTFAAKNKHAERIIVPFVDVMQSVPILGFLSISVLGFVALFPGSMLGPEFACIFAIFTSQAWNMMLGFYQSLRTVPNQLIEAGNCFHLSAWQRFWRIEVPYGIPSLLWNSMMSMSAGWFFVVASEAISVANHQIRLPGIGSYISVAIDQADKTAIFYAVATMFVVILLYDQLLFRPLVAWADKFKAELTPSESPESWVINLFRRTRFFRFVGEKISRFTSAIVNLPLFKSTLDFTPPSKQKQLFVATLLLLGYGFVGLLFAAALYHVWEYLSHFLTLQDVKTVLWDGGATAIRVLVLIVICSFVWVPIGVWVGFRPRVTAIVQPIAQFLAAFPANLLFPAFVYFIVTYQLNVNIWTTPLMILGTQWYILFNIIAGAAAIPKELLQAADIFNLGSVLRWKRLILPGIFPYFVTGAMTAAGGAWNASIVAEVVSWGNTHLQATGLGAYIKIATTQGNFPKVVLGISIMCLFVLLINRIIWMPLYRLAEERFHVE